MFPLDHIGIAVKDLDEALRRYERDFGVPCAHREVVADQKVEVAFLDFPSHTIELLAPSGEGSPVAAFIEKRGEGLHHLCYRVPDIRAELARLEKLGHKLIDTTPRKGARGHLIAFVHPKSMGGVLTELIQA